MADTSTLRKTPLYDALAGKGRFIDFAGWYMPVEFTGIVAEHKAVRNDIGMFDLSHMGEIEIRGLSGLDLVQKCVTNDVSKLEPGAAMYTPVCRHDGNILDDILVYRFPDHVFLVVNASNVDKMRDWFTEQARGSGTTVVDRSNDYALIALQGPKAEAHLAPHTPADLNALRYYHFVQSTVAGVPCILSRTGYTGEDGFELYVENDGALKLWQSLAEATQAPPIGLGARDTLRLECRMALYGNDIDETTNPLEAGLGWTVKLDKGDFNGRDALVAAKAAGLKRHLVGFQMVEGGIPRHGFRVADQGEDLGVVTSGTFSPTLDEAIGLAYVRAGHHSTGTELDVVIRSRTARARIVKTPFYKGSVKR